MRFTVKWIKSFAGLFVGSVVVLSGISMEGMAQTKEAKMAPEEFQKQVIQLGGRVDYLFGDEGLSKAPTPACHASTVVELPDGSLMSAWFGGKSEGDNDVAIWRACFREGKWGAPERAAKVADVAHWNPVLFRDPSQGVFLFFKVGKEIDFWRTYWMKSTDGRKWSDPVELVPHDEGGRGPVKNKPIILASGAWLAPASTELHAWKPFADRSEDHGKTWTRSADFMEDKGIQPTFWESEPGKVHALFRTKKSFIYRSDSQDDGRTWTPAQPTVLPNNNSGIDALRLKDGRILLVYNPVTLMEKVRTPLTLALSEDNGATWKNLAHLENKPGEYSYPAIIGTSKGIAVTYTWKRERIRCWQIPLEALK